MNLVKDWKSVAVMLLLFVVATPTDDKKDVADVLCNFCKAVIKDDYDTALQFYAKRNFRDVQLRDSSIDMIRSQRKLIHRICAKFHVVDDNLSFYLSSATGNKLRSIIDDAKNAKVAVTGDLATIILKDSSEHISMRRIDGIWKLSPIDTVPADDLSSEKKFREMILEQTNCKKAADEISEELEVGKLGSIEACNKRVIELYSKLDEAQADADARQAPSTQTAPSSSLPSNQMGNVELKIGSSSLADLPHAVFSPSDADLFALSATVIGASFHDGRIGVWNVDNGGMIGSATLTQAPELDSVLSVGEGSLHPIALVHISHEDRSGSRLSLFDYATHEMKWEKRGLHVERICGYSNDNKCLFCDSGISQTPIVLDVSTGDVIWTGASNNLLTSDTGMLLGAVVTGNENQYVLVFRNLIVCRDRAGKDLWRADFGEKPELRLPFCGLNGNSRVVVYNSTQRAICLVQLDSEKVEQISKGVDSADWLRGFYCFSPNGDLFINKSSDGVKICNIQNKESRLLTGIDQGWFLKFTSDGNKIVGVANYEVVATDAAHNSLTYKRKSNVAKVFNAKTGELEREIDLTLPKADGAAKSTDK